MRHFEQQLMAQQTRRRTHATRRSYGSSVPNPSARAEKPRLKGFCAAVAGKSAERAMT
jgi:hypothetical protein